MAKNISRTFADLGLLSVTLFWGTTFILSKIVLGDISLASYLAVRLTLAAFFMVLIAFRFYREFNLDILRDGVILGTLLFLSYFFQMAGIRFTSASNAGFITGLSVVLVPVFSVLFFRDRPKIASLAGVVLATVGLYLLSGGDYGELNKGDWLVFVCAITVTFHVIFTGRFARRHNVYLLTAVQLVMTSLLSILYQVLVETTVPSISSGAIWLLVYLALFGTVYTFLVQTAMQRYTTATRTALVFTMEPVFAALFAYLIAGEMLTMLGWLGGGFILGGMIVAEIDWKKIFSNQSVPE
jgi:drug/metabolite transporter (DMT)-like permease